MNVYDLWQIQREPLRPLLTNDTPDVARSVSQVRHAILQTEQNALAELQDDVLRQQAGLLFSCLKNALGLLEIHTAAQVWVPQKAPAKPERSERLPVLLCLAFLIPPLIFLYAKTEWLWFALGLSGAICGLWALVRRPKESFGLPQDEARVTLTLDAERLLSLLDEQMRAIDRQIRDFAYLNDQLRGNAECADTASLARAADLMEALYECDPGERAPAEEAARNLLAGLGLRALDYSEENCRLFNALPSKTETRTLSPAIVSTQDHRLLKRGTAAVRMGAA